MRTQKLLVLLGSVLVLTVAVTLLVWTLSVQPPKPVAVKTIPYVFYVDESPGIDLDTDLLRLGAAPPGGGSNRGLTVAASGDWARLIFSGPGSRMLSADPVWANVTDGTASFVVRLSVPLDADTGTYEGVARVEIYSVN